MRKKESISVTLTKDQISELDNIKKRTGVPRSTLVQQAVDGIIDKYKKQQRLPVVDTR